MTAWAPALAAASAQRTDSLAPYAATPGMTEKPGGDAAIAVSTTRVRSSGGQHLVLPQ